MSIATTNNKALFSSLRLCLLKSVQHLLLD